MCHSNVLYVDITSNMHGRKKQCSKKSPHGMTMNPGPPTHTEGQVAGVFHPHDSGKQ